MLNSISSFPWVFQRVVRDVYDCDRILLCCHVTERRGVTPVAQTALSYEPLVTRKQWDLACWPVDIENCEIQARMYQPHGYLRIVRGTLHDHEVATNAPGISVNDDMLG